MANEWLRLWHDMPTDPKFRVVANASEQPLHLVIALYVALLVDASKNAMSRGVTKCHDEDLSVTLDCDMSQIAEIKAAMQGRLLDGDRLTGWEIRQPKRDDSGNAETGAKSAAERQAAKRERDKQASESASKNECHDTSRKVTLDKEEDKDKEVKDKDIAPKPSATKHPAVQFKSFLADCKDKGEKPISGYKPVFDYAESVSLPIEMVELSWSEFYRRFNGDGTNAKKRYADWRATFRKYVEGNWFKLWWLNPGTGQFELTTAGHTAKRAAA